MNIDYEYISLDNHPRFETTFIVDILDWDYKSLRTPDRWAPLWCKIKIKIRLNQPITLTDYIDRLIQFNIYCDSIIPSKI